jgi:hypothetical protein
LTVAGGALAQAAGHPVSVKAGNYKGTTSEHSRVTFKIVSRSIRNFSTTVYYNGSCGQGGGPGFTIAAKGPMKVDKAGKFSANLTLVGPVKAVKNQKGKLTGKVSGATVTGTIVDTTQEHASFCQHGYNERFTAHKS